MPGGYWPNLVVAFVALVVYGATLAPDLSGSYQAGDGGDLITAAVTLGIPHPPGYPIYVLVGNLISWLPFGTVAYRFNLLSAVATAGSVGVLTILLQQSPLNGEAPPSGKNRVGALAAGLAFAFAPLVWAQATIAEVYGLNLLLLSAFLWALLTGRSGWLVGILLGLSITTHITSLLMLPMALLLTPTPKLFHFGLGLLAGLLPLGTIPLLARGRSPVVWGNPTNLGGWWWLVSGQLYHANLFALPASGWHDRIAEWVPLLLRQFTWAGPLLLAFTFWLRLPANWTTYVASLATATSYVIFALGYGSSDAIVLLLPALILITLLVAPALSQLGWAALLLPLISLLLNFGQMNLSNDLGVRPDAEHILVTAPQRAILMTSGDNTIFALWYFRYVEQLRTDLILVDSNLLAFDWYRQRLSWLHPELSGLDADDLTGFVRKNQLHHPFCFVSIDTVDQRTSAVNRCSQDLP